MIVIALGNFGDLIIQSTLLGKINSPEHKVVVTPNLLHLTRKLLPNIGEIIELNERYNLRAIGDRDYFITQVKSDLRGRYPNESIISFTLKGDQVLNRKDNIYQSYIDLIKNDSLLSTLYTPLQDCSTFRSSPNSADVLIFPIGGIQMKMIPPQKLNQLVMRLKALKMNPKVVGTEYDNLAAYETIEVEKVKLKSDDLINHFIQLATKSKLILSVDTAFYHLGAVSQFLTLAIPGPRSPEHFCFPPYLTKKLYIDEAMLCVDCYSADFCVATQKPGCSAQPPTEDIIAKICELTRINDNSLLIDTKNVFIDNPSHAAPKDTLLDRAKVLMVYQLTLLLERFGKNIFFQKFSMKSISILIQIRRRFIQVFSR